MNIDRDLISNALSAMSVTGSLLLNEFYAPPWAIDIPPTETLCDMLGLAKDARVVAFHLVRKGQFNFQLADKQQQLINAGELVICFGGNQHRMSQGKFRSVVPLSQILAAAELPFRRSSTDPNDDELTELICGVFLLRNTQLNPLYAALPAVFHTSVVDNEHSSALTTVCHLIAQEINNQQHGSPYVTERLVELLCAEIIRVYEKTIPGAATGWFKGLKDTKIATALHGIHQYPERPWTVDELASNNGLSRSRFADRFIAAMGESPMRYLTKWRMNVASRLLDHDTLRVNEVAFKVGYENQAAFSRAFKQHLGLSPAQWRER